MGLFGGGSKEKPTDLKVRGLQRAGDMARLTYGYEQSMKSQREAMARLRRQDREEAARRAAEKSKGKGGRPQNPNSSRGGQRLNGFFRLGKDW